MTSDATARSRAFVTERLPAARALAREVADLATQPEAFATRLTAAVRSLADPEYAAAHARIAPGSTGVLGVRQPLLRPFASAIRRTLRRSSPAIGLYLGDRLSRDEAHEVRLLALPALEASLPSDPERTWQIMRRIGHRASDWITVDSLADVVAAGILLEGYRWAELEQLVYSPNRWERRLVGAALARLPHHLPRAARGPVAGADALTLIESLLGDDEPEVQKALAWALRAWRAVDPDGVEALLRRETATAARNDDGHRASVIREALTGGGAPPYAAELRATLHRVRGDPRAPSTSRAYQIAAAFGAAGFPSAENMPEPPLTVAGVRP